MLRTLLILHFFLVACGSGTKAGPQDKALSPGALSPEAAPKSSSGRVLLLVYNIDLEDLATDTRDQALMQAVATIRKRLSSLKIENTSVLARGNKIEVELPTLNSSELDRVSNLIRRSGRLEFRIVDEAEMNGVTRNDFAKKLYGFSKRDPQSSELGIEVDIDQWSHQETGRIYVDYYLTAEDRREFLSHADADAVGCFAFQEMHEYDPRGRYCNSSGRQVLSRYLEGVTSREPTLHVDELHQFRYERVVPLDPKLDPYWRTYLLYRQVPLSSEHVQTASVRLNEFSNAPEVLIEFSKAGASLLGELTGNNVGRKLAIILDGTITSAPTIQTRISGGTVSITLGGTDPQRAQIDAEDLAIALRAGALPAPLRLDAEKSLL